ncbi:uncharacterized protein LOC111408566 [Olea europaea var. sylvestris]|uniref:uncharacterized protein LOC111408566 n=1 Tax=Olea europaea var. sylvestris TaxID=158386 RepID=UPI000C1D792B|nr:uncharacterized protein LOC111408566 [Olea europaea var. sylvestris]
MNKESGRFDLQTLPQSTSQSYNAFIWQQQNRRQADRRYRNETVSIDRRKRINDRMLSTNNTSKVDSVHEYIIHSKASTSNEEIINTFDSELHGSSNLLSVPATAYVLPTCAYCKHCGAHKLYRETKGFCCSNGKVKLFMLDSSDELYTLFTSKEPVSIEFKKYARSYNNHFVFTSFGVKYDKEQFKAYKCIYIFRIQGQVYHYVNQLMPDNNTPCYIQLYFYDTVNELENRMKTSEHLVESILFLLIEILKVNPYSKFFRSLSNRTDLHEHKIQIRCHVGLDQRVFNTLSTSQVAAIWVEDDKNTNIRVRDITIYGHSGDSHRVHYYYGCYDPLQYPLLFPLGECGWHEVILRYEQKSSHIAQFVDNIVDPNVCLYSFLCLLYFYKCDIESKYKILFILAYVVLKDTRKKRSQVSCREYYSYKLQIRPSDKSVLLHPGRLFQQYVVDMYVKIETSRLDYFRSNQKQIRAELYQGIVDSIHNGETRGYKIGKKFVLPQSFTCGPRDMLRRYLDAIALVQRYGKSDLFITITCNPNWPEIKQELKHNDEVQNRPDLIVRVFRAKLEELKNDLYKRYIFGTIIAHIYVIEFQKRCLPHSHLLLIFNCSHKISSTKQVDKIVSCEILDKNIHPYLHSVIVKHNMHGPCGNLNPKNICIEKNSCKNKYPKDYCNSTIFGDNSYPLYRRRDNGIYVRVRSKMLDNQWVVPYNPYLSAKFDYKLSSVIENENTRKTMLTEFFRVNKINEFARTLLYRDFSTHFVWNASNKTWTPRKKQIFVGRIVSVNPSEGERYFLHLLLNHIRGPISFDDLRTFNGADFGTFREAALLYGLLNGDTRYQECLSEDIIYEMPHSLRRLFSTLLTMCNPNNPKLLWNKFKPYMRDDYVNENMLVEVVEVRALEDISSI